MLFQTRPQPRSLLALTLGILLVNSAFARTAEQAQVTQIINDLRVVVHDDVLHAAVNDRIAEGAEIRTGEDALAELTFADHSVVRLGSGAIFSFQNGTHRLNLGDGTAFLDVPRSARNARICASGVAATLTGTTAIFESHPGVYKFLVLHGTARIYRPGKLGDSVLVGPGQMVIGQPNSAVSDPVDFDIEHFVQTCRFITAFPPLQSQSLIAAECARQSRAKSKKVLRETNLVIHGGGTRVSISNPETADQAPAPPNANAAGGKSSSSSQ